jgi:hypothetical protein
MAFLLLVGVNFGRRPDFVRRNKPDFTSSPSAVKRFFVRHSKSNRGALLGLSFQKYFSQKSSLLAGFPEN